MQLSDFILNQFILPKVENGGSYSCSLPIQNWIDKVIRYWIIDPLLDQQSSVEIGKERARIERTLPMQIKCGASK